MPNVILKTWASFFRIKNRIIWYRTNHHKVCNMSKTDEPSSFLCICNPIIPNFAHGSTVLWETAKKKRDFHWTAIHQKYFQSLPKQFTIIKTGNLCIKDNSNNRTTLRPTRFTCDVPKLYFSKIQKIPNRLLKDRYTCNKDKLIVSFFIRKSTTSITNSDLQSYLGKHFFLPQ